MAINEPKKTRIFQQVGRISYKQLDACDQFLLILPPRPGDADFRALPNGAKMRDLLRKFAANSTPAFTTRLPNKRQTQVIAGRVDGNASSFELLTLGRKLAANTSAQKPGSLGIYVAGHGDATTRIRDAILAAVLASAAAMPSFARKPKRPSISSIRLLGLDERVDTSRVEAEAHGNNLARCLATLPPNVLDASGYTDFCEQLAGKHGWQFERLDTAALEKLGAGAFLAVAQGNEDNSAAIVRLRYRPKDTDSAATLALVGKGIIFDTGGTNLKPANSMLDMHGDMQGSAVALGSLLAISEMQLPLAVDCWLALTENRTGPRAYKQQDVVTAANGKTIQTIHTDAEGRMALADTLVLASREKPDLIIDYATLTGACVTAITNRYSGIFSNRPSLHPVLKRIGRDSGERVWPFPLGEDFAEALKSEVADLLQCAAIGGGDHILAATFLAEFVENKVPWVHIDLSAGDNESGLGHIASKFTGFGVRYTINAIVDADLVRLAAE